MVILIAAFVLALLFFWLFVTQKGKIATTVSILLAASFIGCLVLTIANEDFHFGMKKVTETKTESLVSSLPVEGMNVLLYQPLGNGQEKVYVYRTSDSQKKPSSTEADVKIVNRVEKGSKKAEIVQKETYWDYQNSSMKTLFKMPDHEREVTKQENIFKVPSSWLVLSTTQAKKLQSEMKKEQKTIEKEAKTYVENKVKETVMAEAKKGKKVSTAEMKKLSEQYASEYQKQAIQKILAKIQ